MTKINLVIIFFVIVKMTFAQEIIINVNNVSSGKIYINSMEGEKIYLVDSVLASDGDILRFTGNKLHTGFYRLTFNTDNSSLPKWMEFIYDGEDIEIRTDATSIIDSIKVIKSESNRLYYEFIRLNKSYKSKTDLLQLILARYPKDDEYYKVTQEKVTQLQNKYDYFVKSISALMPNSFIARYVSSKQLPIVDYNLPIEEQLAFLKSHSLDKVDFNDTGLIYSDVFTSKSIEYLMYYRNPQLPKELLEKEFIIAVDTMLSKVKVNPLVYQHITDYLIDGFKQFGFDTVIDYIVENYVVADDLCLDEETENSIQNRIDQAKLLSVGATAPNIILPDSSGIDISLNSLMADKTLIIFYAGWCTHCQKMIPEIYQLYKERDDFEVYAVSLDEDKNAWLDFVKTHNLDWINVSDLLGWGSNAASDYYIYATPTMFLVSKNRRIIGKPLNIEEIISLVSSYK